MDEYSPPLTQIQFDELAEHMELAFPGYGESYAESIEIDIESYSDWKKEQAKDYCAPDDCGEVSFIPTEEGGLMFTAGRWVFWKLERIKRKPGQPVNEGRDRLIQSIFNSYGGRATLTRSDNFDTTGAGHFERTIELVLSYADKRSDEKEAHTIIRRALERTS